MRVLLLGRSEGPALVTNKKNIVLLGQEPSSRVKIKRYSALGTRTQFSGCSALHGARLAAEPGEGGVEGGGHPALEEEISSRGADNHASLRQVANSKSHWRRKFQVVVLTIMLRCA